MKISSILITLLFVNLTHSFAQERQSLNPHQIQLSIVDGKKIPAKNAAQASRSGMFPMISDGHSRVIVKYQGSVIGEFKTAYSKDQNTRMKAALNAKQQLKRTMGSAKRLNIDIVMNSNATEASQFFQVDIENQIGHALLDNLNKRVLELELRVKSLEEK